MKKTASLLFALLLAPLAWGQLEFRTTLTGANEVPARDTPAFGIGHATLDLDTNLFTFEYSFEGLTAPQTGAHIHVGAPGVNGPIRYPLSLGSPVVLSPFPLSDEDVAQLTAGNWYINIHSTRFPGGEIRGQFVPVPEPELYAAGAAALIGVAVLRRRQRAKAQAMA